MDNSGNYSEWKQTKSDIFWGEIAPCDHVVQFYENDGVFLDTLAGFVGSGINSNESCIVIATDNHLEALKTRLDSYNIPVALLITENRYIPLSVEEVLAKFMVNGWPDEDLFIKTIAEYLKAARGPNNRRVRAFGEMIAFLWAQGNCEATVNLEHLWNNFCEKEAFCLFCAYPKTGFTGDMTDSIKDICCAHSKMISGSEKQLTEIFYTRLITNKAV
jgi:MEDS: MEthanogen/methylotroph, DcmR Sensory domain